MTRVECDNDECTHKYTDVDVSKFATLVRLHVKDVSGADRKAPQESDAGKLKCVYCKSGSVKPAVLLYGDERTVDLPLCLTDRDARKVDLMIVAGTALRCVV